MPEDAESPDLNYRQKLVGYTVIASISWWLWTPPVAGAFLLITYVLGVWPW